MAYYRVYLLDAADHIFEGQGIECDSDDTAIAASAEVANNFAVEIWSGARKVAYVAADSTGTSSV